MIADANVDKKATCSSQYTYAVLYELVNTAAKVTRPKQTRMSHQNGVTIATHASEQAAAIRAEMV